MLSNQMKDKDMSFFARAMGDGYADVTGKEGKRKIIYRTSDNYIDNYDDPEERVRAEFWAELIYKYEYPVNRIKIEVTIPDRLPANRADIVIFSDDECKRPYAVVECKKEDVTDAEFNQAIEQGIGNATWIKLRAEYVVIVAGATRRILDVSDKFGIFERELNIIADLPKSYGKVQEYRFYRGTENDIKPVAIKDLLTTIKKCHQTLWGGGRLSPPTAFGELCKLIFVKISDEQKTFNGEPYQFQIRTHETSSKLSERINTLYDAQKSKDPEVFTESIKVDASVIRTIVSHLEAINLSKTDLDVKGIAFEQFMDGFFKGNFGQYFTPRPIIEFIVKMMKPEHDWDVLDPSCGSGGFLLHALDYIRDEAKRRYPDKTDPYEIEACFKHWHTFAEKHLFGIEINDEIARVAKMNMIVHDDGHTNVISYDALDLHSVPPLIKIRSHI
jgi:type I restriction enzyme M protein